MDYSAVKKRIIQYFEYPPIENFIYELLISWPDKESFLVELIFYWDFELVKELALNTYLTESQIRTLIACILYSGISITDNRGGNIFRAW